MMVQIRGTPGSHADRKLGVRDGEPAGIEQVREQVHGVKRELGRSVLSRQPEMVVRLVADRPASPGEVLDLVDAEVLHRGVSQKGGERPNPPVRLIPLAPPRSGGVAGLVVEDRKPPAVLTGRGKKAVAVTLAQVSLHVY